MNELTKAGSSGGHLTVQDMVHQVSEIQALMKQVMKEDVHFGTIPGTQKKALLKPGAEKIGLMFGCRTSYEIEREDLPDGHREYQVTCQITDRQGNEIGQGLGSCTTMEKKYRYRTEFTNAPVPKEYWETKDPNLLGGRDFAPRKVQGKWQIIQQVENADIADSLNTVLKMAKKRAYVDAILTCTAASDFFDQEEVIDTPENFPEHTAEPATQNRREPKAAESGGDGKATANQIRIVRKQMGDKDLTDDMVCKEFGVKSLEELKVSDINKVLEWIDSASN